jgi:hypothetical protein
VRQKRDSESSVLKVKLIPRSSRNLIAGKDGDTYRIKVTAPPVEGKANKALADFLADLLGVLKEDVEILSGKSSRLKTLRIKGLSLQEIQDKIAAQFYRSEK